MQLRGSAADPGQPERTDPGQPGRMDELQAQGSWDGQTDCRPRAVGIDRRTAGPGQLDLMDSLQTQGSRVGWTVSFKETVHSSYWSGDS